MLAAVDDNELWGLPKGQIIGTFLKPNKHKLTRIQTNANSVCLARHLTQFCHSVPSLHSLHSVP